MRPSKDVPILVTMSRGRARGCGSNCSGTETDGDRQRTINGGKDSRRKKARELEA